MLENVLPERAVAVGLRAPSKVEERGPFGRPFCCAPWAQRPPETYFVQVVDAAARIR